MGLALVEDVGYVEAPGAVITAFTAGADSTFGVRNFNLTDGAQLVGLFREGAEAGLIRVRSTKLADNTQGIRFALPAGSVGHTLPDSPLQSLYPQDTLVVEGTGTATAGDYDIAVLQTYFNNLPGASQRLHMPGDISGITEYVTTWEVNCTSSATVGDWGDTLITNLYDESKPNTDYAVLGYIVDTEVAAVALYGNATSSLRCGGPGTSDPFKTHNYFQDLSLRLGKPCVPVFNTADKGSTKISVADKVASTTTNVTLVVAILSQTVTP